MKNILDFIEYTGAEILTLGILVIFITVVGSMIASVFMEVSDNIIPITLGFGFLVLLFGLIYNAVIVFRR